MVSNYKPVQKQNLNQAKKNKVIKNLNIERVCFINGTTFKIDGVEHEIKLCNWKEYEKNLNQIMCRPSKKKKIVKKKIIIILLV